MQLTIHVDSEFAVSIGAGVSVGHNAQVYQRLIDLHRDAIG
jgi:hypothetical protein